MSKHLCDCDEDDEFVRYQPTFVEAYMDNRASPGESIEEWIENEAKHHFAASDIYAPVTVAVAISGTENNGFSIDLTKPDWHSRFQAAVKEVLVVSGLAKVGDVVALEDVRSSSIANKTLEQIIQTPVIYTTVNGKRTIDTQATPAALGCALPTPVTHSINREFKLEEYVGDLCSRAKELLVSNLTDAQSIAEVEQRICVDDHARNLKPVLAAMIMADAGTTGLPNFSKLVETYADPEEERSSYKAIAIEMSNTLLDAVASSMQQKSGDLDAFYKFQQSKSARSTLPTARTIFGRVATSANEAIAIEYPTAQKLHRSILGEALCGNALLGDKLIFSIKKGDVYIRTSGDRTQKKKQHKQQHHHHDQDRQGGGGGRMSNWLHDGHRHATALHTSHRMRGLPPHPEVMNWPGGGVSNTDDRTGDSMIPSSRERVSQPRYAFKTASQALEEDDDDRKIDGIQAVMRAEPPSVNALEMPALERKISHVEVPSFEAIPRIAAEVPSFETFTTKKAPMAETPSLETFVKKSSPVAAAASLETHAKKSSPVAAVEVPSLETYPAKKKSVPIASSKNVVDLSGGSSLPALPESLLCASPATDLLFSHVRRVVK